VHILEQLDDLLARARWKNRRLDARSSQASVRRARDTLDLITVGEPERRFDLALDDAPSIPNGEKPNRPIASPIEPARVKLSVAAAATALRSAAYSARWASDGGGLIASVALNWPASRDRRQR